MDLNGDGVLDAHEMALHQHAKAKQARTGLEASISPKQASSPPKQTEAEISQVAELQSKLAAARVELAQHSAKVLDRANTHCSANEAEASSFQVAELQAKLAAARVSDCTMGELNAKLEAAQDLMAQQEAAQFKGAKDVAKAHAKLANERAKHSLVEKQLIQEEKVKEQVQAQLRQAQATIAQMDEREIKTKKENLALRAQVRDAATTARDKEKREDKASEIATMLKVKLKASQEESLNLEHQMAQNDEEVAGLRSELEEVVDTITAMEKQHTDMWSHHQGAVAMLQAELEQAQDDLVREKDLGTVAIMKNQRAEAFKQHEQVVAGLASELTTAEDMVEIMKKEQERTREQHEILARNWQAELTQAYDNLARTRKELSAEAKERLDKIGSERLLMESPPTSPDKNEEKKGRALRLQKADEAVTEAKLALATLVESADVQEAGVMAAQQSVVLAELQWQETVRAAACLADIEVAAKEARLQLSLAIEAGDAAAVMKSQHQVLAAEHEQQEIVRETASLRKLHAQVDETKRELAAAVALGSAEAVKRAQQDLVAAVIEAEKESNIVVSLAISFQDSERMPSGTDQSGADQTSIKDLGDKRARDVANIMQRRCVSISQLRRFYNQSVD